MSDIKVKDPDSESISTRENNASVKEKTIGIYKAEILMKQLDTWYLKLALFFSMFLVSFVYSTDRTVRGSLQTYATSSYGQHSLLSTINVIKSAVAAGSQPVYARLSDRFGRFPLFIVSVVFYVVGTIVETQAYSISYFAGGSVLWQLGYSGVYIILQFILSDFSNLNWRLVCAYVPFAPFIITVWASPYILDAIYPRYSWNWGIGMWAVIYPCSSIPLLLCYIHMWWKARKTPEWTMYDEPLRGANILSKTANLLVDLFWDLDVIGILFIVAIPLFIFIPITIAGGINDRWATANIIVPLVIGFVLIPPFLYWEYITKKPVMPFPLLKDRGVWAAIMVGVFMNWVRGMPNDYMYTVLMVALNQTQTQSLLITNLYWFVSTLTGFAVGLLIVKFRRAKAFIIWGVCIWFIAIGLLIEFRGSQIGVELGKYIRGTIAGLVLMGHGAGFFQFATEVSIQSCTDHEHMAVVLSMYYLSVNVGASISDAISGAAWTNNMYKEIRKQMIARGLDPQLAVEAYKSPVGRGSFITKYAWGTPERAAVVAAYSHVQKILCIIAICLLVPLLAFCFLLRDNKLESVQSLENRVLQVNKVKVSVNDTDDDKVFAFFRKIFRIKSKPKNTPMDEKPMDVKPMDEQSIDETPRNGTNNLKDTKSNESSDE